MAICLTEHSALGAVDLTDAFLLGARISPLWRVWFPLGNIDADSDPVSSGVVSFAGKQLAFRNAAMFRCRY